MSLGNDHKGREPLFLQDDIQQLNGLCKVHEVNSRTLGHIAVLKMNEIKPVSTCLALTREQAVELVEYLREVFALEAGI